MKLPLDSDGFLRRACPSCSKELKWFYSPAGGSEAATPQEGGYFCPYCGTQAAISEWFTEAQAQLARETLIADVVQPMLMDFKRGAERGNRSGGFVSVRVTVPEKKQPLALSEPNDMRRVEFPCHPTESVKILEDWGAPVRCIVCGATSD